MRILSSIAISFLLTLGQFTSPQRAISPMASSSPARTYVASCSFQNSYLGASCPSSVSVSAGNTVIMEATNTTTNAISLTHSAGTGTINGPTCGYWYTSNARLACYWSITGYASSVSDNFTLTASGGTLTFTAFVVSGGSVDTSASGVNPGASGSPLYAPTVTTTAANELLLVMFMQGGGGTGTVTCSTTPVSLTSVQTPSIPTDGCYGSVATVGSVTPQATSTSSTPPYMAIAVAVK